MFADLPLRNPEIMRVGVQHVLVLLRDPELPVRMEAASSLRYLMTSDVAVEVKFR